MTKKSNRRKMWRRQYLINPKAQLRLILFLTSVVVFGTALFMLIVYQQMVLLLPQTGTERLEIIGLLLSRLGLISTIMIVYFVIAGVVLTNRIVGPIFRLREELNKFVRGEDIHPVKFRGDDDFQEILPLINEVIRTAKKIRAST